MFSAILFVVTISAAQAFLPHQDLLPQIWAQQTCNVPAIVNSVSAIINKNQSTITEVQTAAQYLLNCMLQPSKCDIGKFLRLAEHAAEDVQKLMPQLQPVLQDIRACLPFLPVNWI